MDRRDSSVKDLFQSSGDLGEPKAAATVSLIADDQEASRLKIDDKEARSEENVQATTPPLCSSDGTSENARPSKWKSLTLYLRGKGKNGHTSLAQNFSIWWSAVIAVLLLGNAALFIWSNTSIAAIVWMRVTPPADRSQIGLIDIGPMLGINGTDPQSVKMYQFSLVSSVSLMWSTGTYWLAVIIVLASGAWPYCKILLMGIAWLVPMPVKVRWGLIQTLDFLGKWSLVDMYVMCIMTVSFPTVVAAFGYNINVFVEPVFGFYSFLAAALWNMANNTVIGKLHKRLKRQRSPPRTYLPGKALMAQGPESIHSSPRRAWRVVYAVVGLVLLTAISCVLAGFFVDSYEVTTSGLAAILSPEANGAMSFYNLFSTVTTGTDMPSATNQNFWLWLTTIIFVVVTIVTPIAWLLLMAAAWFLPLPHLWQDRLARAARAMFVWSAADVYLLSIGAAVAELDTLAKGTLPDFCAPLAAFLMNIDCFSVKATFQTGYWVLLAGVVCAYVVYACILIGRRVWNKHASVDRENQAPAIQLDSCGTRRSQKSPTPLR